MQTRPTIRTLLIGAKDTGKTRVIQALASDYRRYMTIPEIFQGFGVSPTEDIDVKRYPFTPPSSNKNPTNFEIFDVARFHTEREDWRSRNYPNLNILVGLFDVSKPETIDELLVQAREAATTLNLSRDGKKFPLVLVGNKTDLGAGANVSQKATEAKKTLEELGFEVITASNDPSLDYTPVSTKNGSGIDDLLVAGLNAAAQYRPEKQAAPAPTVQPAAPVEPEKKAEYLKIIFFGPENTGKTQTLNRLATNDFSNSNVSTIGVDFKILGSANSGDGRNMHNKTDHNFQIWDTAGQERFRTIVNAYYRDAHFLVGFFNVTEESSIDKLYKMAEEANQSAPKGTPLILVGNKADLLNDEESKVTPDKVHEITLGLELMGFKVYTGRQKQGYVSISARDVTGFDEALVPMLNEAAQAAIQIKAEKLAPAAEPAPQAQNKPSESNTGLLDRFVMWVRTPKSSSNDPKPTPPPTQKK